MLPELKIVGIFYYACSSNRDSLKCLLNGPNGVITNSLPSSFIMCFPWSFASDNIYFSLAYFVEVRRYFSWSGNFLRCLTFCLQLSICQQKMHNTSRFDLVLMTTSLVIKSCHSFEVTFSILSYYLRVVYI